MPTLLEVLVKAQTHPGMECTERVEDTEEPRTTTNVPGFENSKKSNEDNHDISIRSAIIKFFTQ